MKYINILQYLFSNDNLYISQILFFILIKLKINLNKQFIKQIKMNKFKERSYTAPIEKDRNQIGKYKEKLDYKFFISKKNNKSNIPKSGLSNIVSSNSTSRKKKSIGGIILLSIIVIIGVLFFFMVISLFLTKQKTQEI